MAPIGLSPRKQPLTLYFMNGFSAGDPLLAQLGRYSLGKGRLYIKRLSDIDQEVLRQLICQAIDVTP